METFEYLVDDALLDSTNDGLKHHSIAETLKTIILKAPLPFTIGLFGRWGAGKSTIANFLKEKLNEGKKRMPVVIFDVWKYENDSLRRQFLFDLVKQLQTQSTLDKKFKVDSQLTNSISKTVQGDLIVNKGGLTALIIILITGAIVAGIAFLNIYPDWFAPYTAFTIPTLVTTIGVATLLKYITQSITTETKTISNNRFSDPDQFENEFGRIISTSTAERIVIIFDNLDRVTHDKAIELLSTIKTFLEPKSKKCIFLVPCDENAIKTYLDSVYTKPGIKTDFDADEFLRKFFNTFIRIPDFIGADLEEYTKEQLKKTKIDEFQNNADLISVITQAFRDNPRQIKQFINTLLSHYLLASEREKGKDPLIKPSGTITKNTQFLAKILIIKQKWPKFYSEMGTDPNIYYNISTGDSDLTTFLMGTNITTTDNLRAFIYLKQPKSKLEILGVDAESLEIAFKDNKIDDALKLINTIKKEELEESKLFNFIKILLSENKGSKQTLVNIISITELILKDMNISLIDKRDFCESIVSTISSDLTDVLITLPTEFVFSCLQESRKMKRGNIINGYISLLSTAKEPSKTIPDKFLISLTNHINQYPLLFENEKQSLKTSLTNGIFDNIPVLELLLQNENSVKEYITPELMQKLINSTTVNDFVPNSSSNIFKKKMDLLFNYFFELDNSLVKDLMMRFNELINQFNQNPSTPENENSLKEILKYSEKLIIKYKAHIQASESDNMVRIINESLSKISNQTLRTPFIPTLFYIRDLVSEPNKGLIDTIINQYGQHGNLQSFVELIANRDKEEAIQLLSPIKQHIENFGVNDISFLDFIWEYESEDDKNQIILNLIARDQIESALNIIEKEQYKLKEDKQIIQQLLNKATASLQLKSSIYDTIKNMKFANDENLMNIYLSQIEQLITTVDNASQSNGYQSYSNSKQNILMPLIIAFVERIITWLLGQNPITLSHRYPLLVAFSHWKDIDETHKENLLTILFDKILTTTQSIDDINMVADLIKNIKISKKLLSTHKNKVEERINLESNNDIKSLLQELLSKIK